MANPERDKKREKLEAKILLLERELAKLRATLSGIQQGPVTVITPAHLKELVGAIEGKIRDHFSDLRFDPENGEITVNGQRYVLFRSDSLSHEFHELIKSRYNDLPEKEAVSVANNFLYDHAKVIGKYDAKAFHKRLKLTDPLERLSAGPVHFAFTGWANVELYDESNPTVDEHFLLKFRHHNSFEAQAWIKAGKKSTTPVCTMNCGYSAGWCEESYGIPLTTVEISCEAKGDEACVFVMAPTDKIEQHIGKMTNENDDRDFDIPVFFKRQQIEAQLRNSIQQKEVLIKEIHHRVKNNLQVIISLLRLQMDSIRDPAFQAEFESSINRVSTMAVIHDLMYQRKDLDHLSLQCYCEDLTRSLVHLYQLNSNTEVKVDIDIKDVEFNLDQSIPLALIMNEITCNAFKHALVDGGQFYVKLRQDDTKFILVVGDTGSGFTEKKNPQGLGLALIEILVEQIGAELQTKNTKQGLEYTIVFNLMV